MNFYDYIRSKKVTLADTLTILKIFTTKTIPKIKTPFLPDFVLIALCRFSAFQAEIMVFETELVTYGAVSAGAPFVF